MTLHMELKERSYDITVLRGSLARIGSIFNLNRRVLIVTDSGVPEEYAKEVAIGKALGILKGSGDGTYNPEEAISRQDLMVICARGLRLARRIADADYKTAIANFSDKGLIADYAVNDIGAMVSSRIITGNPDLTINPLGNTTRAEAAVIMDRITKQN